MKHFTAYDAKKETKKVKDENLNYQRIYILDEIKRKSKLGQSSVQLFDYEHVYLFDSDWEFFKMLGYEIEIPPKHSQFRGKISW